MAMSIKDLIEKQQASKANKEQNNVSAGQIQLPSDNKHERISTGETKANTNSPGRFKLPMPFMSASNARNSSTQQGDKPSANSPSKFTLPKSASQSDTGPSRDGTVHADLPKGNLVAQNNSSDEPTSNKRFDSISEIDDVKLMDGLIAPEKPERNLADDLGAEAKNFIDNLDALYFNFDDADAFVAIVGRVFSEMKTYPHLEQLLAPEDSQCMLRGLRASAGMAQIKKKEKREKYQPKKSKLDAGLLDSLNQLMGMGGLDVD